MRNLPQAPILQLIQQTANGDGALLDALLSWRRSGPYDYAPYAPTVLFGSLIPQTTLTGINPDTDASGSDFITHSQPLPFSISARQSLTTSLEQLQ